MAKGEWDSTGRWAWYVTWTTHAVPHSAIGNTGASFGKVTLVYEAFVFNSESHVVYARIKTVRSSFIYMNGRT